jgi:hypothetical protein
MVCGHLKKQSFLFILGNVRFQGLLECIVPYKKVPSKATLILLQWVFTYYHTAGAGSVKSALEWIIGKQCTLLNIGQFMDQHIVC